MKNLIYLAAATLAFAVQGVAFATNTLDDVDFKQIVCSSLQGSNDKVEALTQVLSMTQSVITSQQKQTLVQLANDDMNSQSYCQNVDL
jgi:uncharacterized protein (DUF1501 family)